jgi:hypothetical protein
MRRQLSRFASLFVAWFVLMGTATGQDLKVVEDGKTKAVVVVDAKAGKWEQRAAADLAKYVERLGGAKPALANTDAAIEAALKTDAPLLIVGAVALKADPTLAQALAKAGKKDVVASRRPARYRCCTAGGRISRLT